MKRNNVIIYLGTALLAFGQSFSQANYPSYVEVLGGGIVGYGVIQSIQTLTNFLFIIPAALIADKFGHRLILISGTVISALAYLLIAFTPSWEFLLVGAFGTGLSRGMILPSGVAILAHGNRSDRIKVFTRNEIARWGNQALGFFASSLFFSLFQNVFSYQNLQFTLIVTLTCSVTAVIPALLLKNANDWKNDFVKKPRVPLKAVIRTPEGKFIAGFLVIQAIIGFGAGFLVYFTQPYFVRRFLLGPSEISLLMGISQIITTAFMVTIPLLANRLSDIKLIYLTQGLSVPLILVLAYSNLLPLSIIAFLLRIALMNMSSPAQTAILQKYVNENARATVQSFMEASDRIGRSISPSLSALMIEETNDFTSSFTVTAVMYFLAVSILFFITRFLKGEEEKEEVVMDPSRAFLEDVNK